jgi:hypothetical protein
MHPIVPYARAAYAQGWAGSGGPLTAQVRAGCIAAVALACTHAEQPNILEVTLQLGALEGTWAAVYARRAQLHRDAAADVLAAWRGLHLADLAPEIVAAARQHTGLPRERARPGYLDWIGELLRRLFGQRVTVDAWHRLSAALTRVLGRAAAEGQTAALALAAQRYRLVGFDFDLAFHDAYQALTRIADLSGQATVDAWLTRLLGDAATEVGSRLATLTADGAPYQDMVDAVADLLSGATSQAVSTAVDVLTSRALSQGALDLYRSEGVRLVDFLTAGGGACPLCQALEAKNPYPVDEAPLSGQHPHCRCAVTARDDLPAGLLTRYTTTPAPTAAAADAAEPGL